MKICKVFLSFCLFVLLMSACSQEIEETGGTISSPEVCTFSLEESNVISELNDQYANPFESSDPTSDDRDIDRLIEYLGQAQFVGLGEATHGTHEFYQMKDKIFRALVMKKAFNAIIFEIPWGNALVINDYVLNGIGDLDEVVNQSYYWVYNTAEVKELVEWMHTYNLSRSDDEKIYFLGCDVQGGDFKLEIDIVYKYLFEIDPNVADSLVSLYNNLPESDLFDYQINGTALHNSNKINCEQVLNYLSFNRHLLINLSDEYSYNVALMAADVIREREFVYRTSSYGEHRDALMAKYSEWWQSIIDDNASVVIWAHNSHVNDGSSLNINYMGTALKASQGRNYLAVGFSFGKGRLNAFVANADFSFKSSVTEQHIDQIPCNTINALLSEVDGEQHYILFEALGQNAFDYFIAPKRFMQIGAGFNPLFIQNYIFARPMSQYFDVLIHFDETEASVF